ncbi:maleylpyruvate isomerase N-terminal domain-containing protein [Streptomyces mirabilis]|uniref:maleylpyruvate isomerase N-terminal domain-containing protein n=1 Tax=Streptomyces mirabilis TaxID=68239 RepID=UPI0036E80E21
MTCAGIATVRSSTAQLVESIPQVDDEQWELPSACGGWRVIDGVAHLAALASEAVDPPPPGPSLPKNRERYQDLRFDETPWLEPCGSPRRVAAQHTPAAGPPGSGPGTARGRRGRRGARARYVSAPSPGEHHGVQRLLPLAQQHARPYGPLPFTLPEPTDGQVAPAVDFMLAGLPQMQGPELNATVDGPSSSTCRACAGSPSGCARLSACSTRSASTNAFAA